MTVWIVEKLRADGGTWPSNVIELYNSQEDAIKAYNEICTEEFEDEYGFKDCYKDFPDYSEYVYDTDRLKEHEANDGYDNYIYIAMYELGVKI